MYLEDFAGNASGAVRAINQWVSDETNGKIQNLLSNVATTTRLVLVNALYFDAYWRRRFDRDQVGPGSFDTDAGPVPVTIMTNVQEQIPVAHTDAYDAVEVAYSGDCVMDIVLPKAGTFAAFEPTLTAASLEAIVSSLAPADVELTLPKFGYQGDAISLVPMLQSLGMNVAFTSGADLRGIAPGALSIGDVVHEAFLRVDELGTEAAAASAEEVNFTSAVTSSNVVVVDHPFFFTIRDTATNTILFAGRILDPTK